MAQRRVLTLLARDLQEDTGSTTSYKKIWQAAVNGTIPVERGENGRWSYDRADVPLIAAALGLTPPRPRAPSALAA